MTSSTVYVFHFSDDGDITRIPYAKWKRIRSGGEVAEGFADSAVHIVYAYILLENRKPDYCPHIEGRIYYFDASGRVIVNEPYYFDLFQDMAENAGGVIDLQHRKKKKAAFKKYCWELSSRQVQAVIDSIW